MAQRRTEEIAIELDHRRVFMRLSKFLAFILRINGPDSRLARFVGRHSRLPAAPDASARTSHHFNEMELLLS